jgi:hypothetical protein
MSTPIVNLAYSGVEARPPKVDIVRGTTSGSWLVFLLGIVLLSLYCSRPMMAQGTNCVIYSQSEDNVEFTWQGSAAWSAQSGMPYVVYYNLSGSNCPALHMREIRP